MTKKADIANEPLDVVLQKILNKKLKYYDDFRIAFSRLSNGEYQFTPQELEMIFKKEIWWQGPGTVAFQMASTGCFFSIENLVRYKNPACRGNWTVAHEMAKQGYVFSVEDLELLGNPADNRNLTIQDVMALQNNLSSVENKQTFIENGEPRFSACASYDIHAVYETAPKQPRLCIHCGSNLEQTEIKASAYTQFVLSFDPIPAHWYSYLFTCKNCQWWCVRESFSLCEIMRDEDILLIGVRTNNQSGLHVDQKPWKKYLQEESVYFHDLVMTDEIKRLFQ